MLAIKLKLIGKKGQRSFRVIVQERRAKLNGKFVDDLGWYNPHSNQVKVNQEKLKHWLKNGAQLTESAEKVVEKAKESSGVQSYEGRKTSKKKKKDKEPRQEKVKIEPSSEKTPAEDREGRKPVNETKESSSPTSEEEAPKEKKPQLEEKVSAEGGSASSGDESTTQEKKKG